MKQLILFLILSYCNIQTNAQQWLNKSQPQPGENVIIQIPLKETILKEAKEVYAYLYVIKENRKENEVHDLLLKKEK